LNTKEGRLKWVEVSWAFTEMTKKWCFSFIFQYEVYL
jgi:hypothetical protein